MDYNEQLKHVTAYITSFYTKETDTRLVYHNYAHTWEMIDAANRIITGYALDERSRFIVLSAIWFYDAGYLVPGSNDHKNKSAELAALFLKNSGLDESDITEIKDCIMATKMPQQPKNLTEEIVCDTIMFYLGTENYAEKSKLLKKETEALNNIKISGEEWRKKSISLMENHQFFTDYCQTNLNKTKIANLDRLKRKQEKKSAEEILKKSLPVSTATPTLAGSNTAAIPGQDEVPDKKHEKKKDKPSRGLETLFRISTTNHQRLSSMADNKAHIMISVNSIIISVLLGLIVRKLDKYEVIIIPTILMLLANVATIIFSVLATRPRVPGGIFTKEQIEKKDIDLTFFGNFYKMGFPDYESGMKKLMKDQEFIYGSLIRNIYGQAKVLGQKFRYLRISYNIFMIGISISVITFAVVFIFFNK
jgi:predicted metal-dependent HD superfamily phosphohydrolase